MHKNYNMDPKQSMSAEGAHLLAQSTLLSFESTLCILYSTCPASPQSRSESHPTLLHTSTGTEKFLYSHMTHHSGRDYCSCRDHLNTREGMDSLVECAGGHTYHL